MTARYFKESIWFNCCSSKWSNFPQISKFWFVFDVDKLEIEENHFLIFLQAYSHNQDNKREKKMTWRTVLLMHVCVCVNSIKEQWVIVNSKAAAKHLFRTRQEWPMIIMMIDRLLFFLFRFLFEHIIDFNLDVVEHLLFSFSINIDVSKTKKNWTFVQVNKIMTMLIFPSACRSRSLSFFFFFSTFCVDFIIRSLKKRRRRRRKREKMSVTKWREEKRKAEIAQTTRLNQNEIRSVVGDVLWTINNSSERDVRRKHFSFFDNLQ